MTDVNPRELALNVLIDIDKGAFGHVAVREVLDANPQLAKNDRAFFTRLVEGTVEQKIYLDYVINQFSKVKVNKMKPLIRNLIRMGAYQILFMERVPDSAACNESVKLAVKRKFVSLKGFVNGVLRTISREKEQIVLPDAKKEPVQSLSIRYSFPEWIVKKWMADYGQETTEGILKAFLEQKPLSIRTNLLKVTSEQLKQELEEENVIVKENIYVNQAFFLEQIDAPKRLKTFQQGKFYIQDTSSMLAVQCAGIKGNESVIDVCAAPGGKSLYAASLLTKDGHVTARDLSEKKVNQIIENIARSGQTNIHAEVWDACELKKADKQSADLVIADLPCSGLGVIGRKSDIKYHASEKSLEELSSLQRQILSVVASYVKQGGTLLYSTCTINKGENEDNVSWFLENFPFEPISLEDTLPEELWNHTAGKGYVQLLPNIGMYHDGFFIAKFKKKVM